ncbi:Uncharacterised protein [uncultured archaeon]|nr:Uncharacterised protein [uncultured archaeon]
MIPQVGFDSRTHILCAAVDEDALAVELQQDGVALAHIQEVDGEVLVGGHDSCRDDDDQDG